MPTPSRFGEAQSLAAELRETLSALRTQTLQAAARLTPTPPKGRGGRPPTPQGRALAAAVQRWLATGRPFGAQSLPEFCASDVNHYLRYQVAIGKARLVRPGRPRARRPEHRPLWQGERQLFAQEP